MSTIPIAIALIITSCGSPNERNWGNNEEVKTETVVNDTISFSDLVIDFRDSTIKEYYFYNKQLYSGHAVQYEEANDGMWSFVYFFDNGIMQRLDVYGINGYQHRYVEMKNGFEYHTVMFYRNGNRYLESFYDTDKNKIGIWKRWHKSGELDWEQNYDN